MFRAEELIEAFKSIVDVMEKMKSLLKSGKISPEETVFFFDLDLTIFDRIHAIMSDLNPAARRAFIEALAAQDPKYSEFAYANSPYKLVEEMILDLLALLREKGVLVLGLTSRRTGKQSKDALTYVQEDAFNSLIKLGVDFRGDSKNIIPDKEFEPGKNVQLENRNLLPYAIVGNPQIFNGIVFTSNYQKSDILKFVIHHLEESLGRKIKDVIVMDDNSGYLTKIRDAFQEDKATLLRDPAKADEATLADKEFYGIHYTFAHDHKIPLDMDVVEKQKECILAEDPSFPTDEEAAEMVAASRICMVNG